MDCMTKALRLGCNFFDAAEVYADGQAESVMGKAPAARGVLNQSNGHRAAGCAEVFAC